MCLDPASKPTPCTDTDCSTQQAASDNELIATTILKETGFKKTTDSYNALAWEIYNRLGNPQCAYPTNARDVVMQPFKDKYGNLKMQYEVNEPFNGQTCVSRDKLFWFNGKPLDTKSNEYMLSLQLAQKLVSNMPPSPQDPTGNRVFHCAENVAGCKSNNPDPKGVSLGGNWFYDTAGSISCLKKNNG